MDELKYNHEGYVDPTAHAALRSTLQMTTARIYRPLTYVCSPFAGDVEHNVQCARRFCRFAMEQGRIPIAPHLLFPQFLCDEDEDERALGLFMGLVLLRKCKELWVFGGRISAGMEREIVKAAELRIPVRYFTEDMKEATDEPTA